MNRSLLFAAAAVILNFVGPVSLFADAPAVTWETPQNITDGNFIDTSGSSKWAIIFTNDRHNPGPTLGDAYFFDNPYTSVLVGNFLLLDYAGLYGQNSAFGSSQSPYASLTSDHQSIIQAGAYWSETFGSFSILSTALTNGREYLFQAWVNDSRGDPSVTYRTETFSASNGGASSPVTFNTQHAEGGLGQSIVGRFVANGEDVNINIIPQSGDTAQLNALQLRELDSLGAPHIPEPASTALLIMLAAGGIKLRRRRKP